MQIYICKTHGTYPAWLSNKVTSFMDGFGEAMFYIIFYQLLVCQVLCSRELRQYLYDSLH